VNIEIRAARDAEELATYGRIVSYVFAENDPANMEAELRSMSPDWTVCGFVDGEMVSTLGMFPFTVRLNGNAVPMGGVTAVGTLPAYRRKGILRKVMTQSLATMKERKQSYAILWASMAAIYQRFGYGLATTQVNYSFDPRYGGFESGAEPTGVVRLLSKDDAFPIIKQIYIEHATPRNLHIHRSRELWEVNTLRPRKKDEPIYIGVYHNAEGDARGYVVYSTAEGPRRGPGPNQELTVKDFVTLDLDAYRGLWEYLRRHDLVGTVSLHGCLPEDDPAPDLLLEPRMLQRRTTDGIWMRVVDVETALPQRPYGGRGDLTIAVAGDDICPWNNGSYLLETDGLTSAVARTDRHADITVSPNVLASLLAGHRSATRLERAGLIEAASPTALENADRLFATTYAPHCPNGF
jgi:predicted acetyltransferase